MDTQTYLESVADGQLKPKALVDQFLQTQLDESHGAGAGGYFSHLEDLDMESLATMTVNTHELEEKIYSHLSDAERTALRSGGANQLATLDAAQQKVNKAVTQAAAEYMALTFELMYQPDPQGIQYEKAVNANLERILRVSHLPPAKFRSRLTNHSKLIPLKQEQEDRAGEPMDWREFLMMWAALAETN